MRVFFLGTAASISSKDARLSSTALQLDDGSLILLDTGEDVQRAFQEAGLKINKKTTILISHMHGDHVIGLPGLLFRFNLQNRSRPIHILGPKGLFFYLLSHRLTVGLNTKYDVIVHEIDLKAGRVTVFPSMNENFTFEELEEKITFQEIEDGLIFNNRGSLIKAFFANHTAPQNFSYMIKENEKPGKFYPDVALKLGIPRGHLWGRLQRGKSVTVAGGKKFSPVEDGITGPPRPGRIVVYSGDTTLTPAIQDLAKDDRSVDLLIHEATFLEEKNILAKEKKHSTAMEVAKMAAAGNVKKLALTHFSSRYIDRLEDIEAEASKFFPGVVIATDGLVLDL